jgi:L-methionine (R)-S-oxide reductase
MRPPSRFCSAASIQRAGPGSAAISAQANTDSISGVALRTYRESSGASPHKLAPFLPIRDIRLGFERATYDLLTPKMLSSVISPEVKTGDKGSLYREMHQALQAVLTGETDFIANLANSAALLFWSLPAINWAGFYLLKEEELVLGPFQGKIACVRIRPGRGVCGTAAEKRQTLMVANVHEFPGHIACDSASNSEIVVPIIKDGLLVGVLDIDSPEFARFDDTDKAELEKFVQILTDAIPPQPTT